MLFWAMGFWSVSACFYACGGESGNCRSQVKGRRKEREIKTGNIPTTWLPHCSF